MHKSLYVSKHMSIHMPCTNIYGRPCKFPYTCTCACTPAHMSTRTSVNVHTRVYAHVHVHFYTPVHAYVYKNVRTCRYTCPLYMPTCITRVCPHVYTHVHKRVHTVLAFCRHLQASVREHLAGVGMVRQRRHGLWSVGTKECWLYGVLDNAVTVGHAGRGLPRRGGYVFNSFSGQADGERRALDRIGG